MTPIAPVARSPRLLLALATLLALVLATMLAGPAAAQFVDEESDDEAVEQPTDQPADEAAAEDSHDGDTDTDEASSTNGGGFVDSQETAPVGGVDAGFGGGPGSDGGLGVPHATAAGLLVIALAGHVANARRFARG